MGQMEKLMTEKIQYHWQLDVYKLSVEAAMDIYELSKSFSRKETYSLTDQVRRSSRAVSGQIAEGWRRRRYQAAFVNKMNEAEGEAAETQVWLEYAIKCSYIRRENGARLHKNLRYDYWKTSQHGKSTSEVATQTDQTAVAS